MDEVRALMREAIPYVRAYPGPYGKLTADRMLDFLERLAPASDPSETLALIAEHRLTVQSEGDGWFVSPGPGAMGGRFALTIGDAVRACVARIKEER